MRFYDAIGFETTAPKTEGSDVWVPTTVEKKYYGDIVRNSRRLQSLDYLSTNDDVNISNQIILMAYEIALQHYQ